MLICAVLNILVFNKLLKLLFNFQDDNNVERHPSTNRQCAERGIPSRYNSTMNRFPLRVIN